MCIGADVRPSEASAGIRCTGGGRVSVYRKFRRRLLARAQLQLGGERPVTRAFAVIECRARSPFRITDRCSAPPPSPLPLPPVLPLSLSTRQREREARDRSPNFATRSFASGIFYQSRAVRGDTEGREGYQMPEARKSAGLRFRVRTIP